MQAQSFKDLTHNEELWMFQKDFWPAVGRDGLDEDGGHLVWQVSGDMARMVTVDRNCGMDSGKEGQQDMEMSWKWRWCL